MCLVTSWWASRVCLQSVLDDVMMSIQYVVEAVDESTEFVQTALGKIKDSPLGAMRDIDRGVQKWVNASDGDILRTGNGSIAIPLYDWV